MTRRVTLTDHGTASTAFWRRVQRWQQTHPRTPGFPPPGRGGPRWHGDPSDHAHCPCSRPAGARTGSEGCARVSGSGEPICPPGFVSPRGPCPRRDTRQLVQIPGIGGRGSFQPLRVPAPGSPYLVFFLIRSGSQVTWAPAPPIPGSVSPAQKAPVFRFYNVPPWGRRTAKKRALHGVTRQKPLGPRPPRSTSALLACVLLGLAAQTAHPWPLPPVGRAPEWGSFLRLHSPH